MFERIPVNIAPQQQPSVPAELTLDEGRVLKGKFHISGTKRIFDVLNGSDLFLDFEQYEGQRELIAKSTIRAIKLITVPRARDLKAPSGQSNDDFNPHKILGLDNTANDDEIRNAYHRLSKIYHPDRYASSGLPKEVLDYLNNSSRRINAAFEALKTQAREKAQAARTAPVRSQPIYTSRGQR